jgi:hypothetical protein
MQPIESLVSFDLQFMDFKGGGECGVGLYGFSHFLTLYTLASQMMTKTIVECLLPTYVHKKAWIFLLPKLHIKTLE